MPKVQPIQHSFTAGELSPRMITRSDLEIFYKGLVLSQNMHPVSQGPIEGRSGTDYLGQVTGTDGRIFGFQRAWNEAYIVIISDNGNIYVSDEVSSTLGPELIANNQFNLGLVNWNVTSTLGSVSVSGGILSLTSAVVLGDVSVDQEITIDEPTHQHRLEINMPDNDGYEIEIRIGTSQLASDIALFVEGGTHLEAVFTPGAGNTSVWVSLFKASGNGNTKRVNDISIREMQLQSGWVNYPHPWANNLEYIHAKQPPGSTEMYFTHPNFPPQVLTYTGPGSWSFSAIAFTSAPAAWTGTSYPRTLAFFQGRSWWGGPGETFYASQSGDYTNLTIGTNADDGMEFTMDKQGEIVWLTSLKNLLIGTRNGEHVVTSQNGIIIPGDIQVEQQSAYGSNHCQPIRLGNKAAYVTNDGRKLQDIGYQWTAEQWLSEDLLYYSEHLTEDYSIFELFWAQNPFKYIVALLESGTALIGLYDPTKQVIGWSRYITDGNIISIAKLEIEGNSIYFFLTSRGGEDGSQNPLLYLEVVSEDHFMDSSVEQLSLTPTTSITGITHLANREVAVTVDDAVHPNITLDENGDGTIQWAGTIIVVGLPYRQTFITMPRDLPSTAGTLFGTEQRWNKIWLRVRESVVPYILHDARLKKLRNPEDQDGRIGVDISINDVIAEHLIKPPDRHPDTPMDVPQDLVTADVQISTLGYTGGAIMVVNDLPKPLNVYGLFGELGVASVG